MKTELTWLVALSALVLASGCESKHVDITSGPKTVREPSPRAVQSQPKIVQTPEVATIVEQKPELVVKKGDAVQLLWDKQYTQANIEALNKIDAYVLNTLTEKQFRDDRWPDAAASLGRIGIVGNSEDDGASRYELGHFNGSRSVDPNVTKPSDGSKVTACELTFKNGVLVNNMWDEALISRLAEMYRKGQGVAQDDKKVAEWYAKAAEQGEAQSQLLLGSMYYKGDGVPKDFKKAAKWYAKAAEQGVGKAQLLLALMYYNGDGVGKDFKQAAKWYVKAAEQGVGQAQLLLGQMYYKGQGVAKNPNDAAKWYAKAAGQGDAQAQLLLGLLYLKGEGVAQDFKNAARWCTKAAAQGVPKAQAMIGLMYYSGQGVPKDYDQAAKWCMNAAVKGVAEAQAMIGAMYLGGQGVSQNDVEAYKWALLAIKNGANEAEGLKEMLDQKMTPGQIEEANRRAREFRVK